MASKFNIPRYIHSYDPLPGSTDWGENEIIRKATIKILKKYFKTADRLSAVSPRMVDYFRNLYDLKETQVKTVYMPIHYYDLPQVRSRKIKFLYLGSIYCKRDPKQLYRVLNDMMENNPTIEFVLAGSKLDRNILIEQYKNFGFGLEFIEWTDSPNQLIQDCTILLDLNSNTEGDVFISSKLMKYLGYNKPILVIGHKESASYDFSSKFSGVYFASNTQKDIESAMNHIFESISNELVRKTEVASYSLQNIVENYINN